MGELLREKLLLCLDKEIPHGTAVEITKFSERDSGVVDVDATIYCEKASHKGIIIGKQGAMLKKISTLARAGYGKVHGHEGLSADLGQGQGELAGQRELCAQPGLSGRITPPDPAAKCRTPLETVRRGRFACRELLPLCCGSAMRPVPYWKKWPKKGRCA